MPELSASSWDCFDKLCRDGIFSPGRRGVDVLFAGPEVYRQGAEAVYGVVSNARPESL